MYNYTTTTLGKCTTTLQLHSGNVQLHYNFTREMYNYTTTTLGKCTTTLQLHSWNVKLHSGNVQLHSRMYNYTQGNVQLHYNYTREMYDYVIYCVHCKPRDPNRFSRRFINKFCRGVSCILTAQQVPLAIDRWKCNVFNVIKIAYSQFGAFYIFTTFKKIK